MKHRLCPGCGSVTELAIDKSWIHSDDDSPECKDSDTTEMRGEQ